MVADLVDQHMGDDVAQRLLVLGPVVEDGAAVERDAVRPLAGLRVPALGDAAPLEQAEQIEGRLQRQVVISSVGKSAIWMMISPVSWRNSSGRWA